MEMIFHEEKKYRTTFYRDTRKHIFHEWQYQLTIFQSKKMEKEGRREPSDECQNNFSLINFAAVAEALLGGVKGAMTFDVSCKAMAC